MNKKIITLLVLISINQIFSINIITNQDKNFQNLKNISQGIQDFSDYQLSVANLSLIFEGVLKGIAIEENLTYALKCLTQTKNEGQMIAIAIQDFKSQDKQRTLDGLKILAQVLEQLPQVLKECKALVKDIQKLESLIKAFKNPYSYVFHVQRDIIVNGVQIYKDIKGAVQSYDQQPKDYFNFGQYIGDALVKVFIGEQMITNTFKTNETFTINNLKQVFEGVLQGIILNTTDYTSALQCIKNSETEGQLIYQAVQDFRQDTALSTLKGLKLLGRSLENLPQILRECKTVESDILKIEVIIKSFTSPYAYFFHVGHDIYVNGIQIYHDITGAVNAFESNPKQYFQFGLKIGDALEKIFIGDVQIIKK